MFDSIVSKYRENKDYFFGLIEQMLKTFPCDESEFFVIGLSVIKCRVKLFVSSSLAVQINYVCNKNDTVILSIPKNSIAFPIEA